MKTTFLRLTALLSVAVLSAVACKELGEPEQQNGDELAIEVSLPGADVKTTMGPSAGGSRKVYWTNGDCMSLNGTTSSPLSNVPEQSQKATFSFSGSQSAPYKFLYPASFYKNANTITLPATQTFSAGSFATGTEPLCGYSSSATSGITLSHLCSVIQLSIKKASGISAGTIQKITFKGNNGEQVSGDFTIDYAAHTLTGASSADASKSVALTLSQTLSETQPLEVYLVVPAGTYSQGFCVMVEDSQKKVTTKTKLGSVELPAGKLARMTQFTFTPGNSNFELEDLTETIVEPDDYNIKGRVVDNSGNPLPNVVVSDGEQCVRTMVNGAFYINSSISNVRFVFVSTPDGYMPKVTAGIPKHYKAKADVTPSGGIYNFGDFVLTPMANPNRFTIFMSADPQERQSNATLDNVAYRSTRARESLFLEQKETAEKITDRQVIGICLGDLVHGYNATSLALMDDFAGAMADLGYPTYCIMGNHDYDTSKDNDDDGAWKFETKFGPRNYSFTMGGYHFVVLDDILMKKEGTSLSAYDYGLSDRDWTWLQNDMKFVPKDMPVMVCAHSPMFKLETGSERTNTSKHGGSTSNVDGPAYGYGDLFDSYDKVYAWAGHTHSTYNYIYGQSHRHKNIEVHTLARSTGELWTNEYLSAGTPQGFTIIEIDNGNISWRFHPTKYLKSIFHGSNGQPSYNYRDWNYTTADLHVAKMKDTGNDLDETYQMHVYAPGSYEAGYVYANVFLWDEKWDTPKFTPAGGSTTVMEHVQAYDKNGALASAHDLATTEFKTFYKANYGSTLGSSYTAKDKGLHTLFKVPVNSSVHSGTVSVTDRFGNVYSRTISW